MPLLRRHWPRLRPQTRMPRTTEPRYTAHHTTTRAQIARETTRRPPRNRHTSAEPVAGTPSNTWPWAVAKASSADLRTHLPHRRNEQQGRDRERVAQESGARRPGQVPYRRRTVTEPPHRTTRTHAARRATENHHPPHRPTYLEQNKRKNPNKLLYPKKILYTKYYA